MTVEVTEQLLTDLWRSWLELLHDLTAARPVGYPDGETKHGVLAAMQARIDAVVAASAASVPRT